MNTPLALVPAFNEEQTVGAVVEGLLHAGLDVCVIDDGSDDTTAEAARTAGAVVLSLPVNLGVGGALRCGFRWAVEHDYDTVVQVDADGQHDPEQVRTLLAELEHTGAEMVIGSRFTDGSGAYAVSGGRRLAMRLLEWRARRATGAEIADTTSGFRAIRRPLLDRFAEDYPVEYLGDTVEALILAGTHGATIREVGVTMAPRQHGEPSAGTLASIWYVLRVLTAIELMHRRHVRRHASLRDAEPAT